MRQGTHTMAMAAALVLLASPVGAQGAKPLTKCAPDAVVSGTVCMDKYEASVWRVSDPLGANKGLVKKIQNGKATVADLAAGGATQLGVGSDDYSPMCGNGGQDCANDIYAVSLAGVTPSAYITWFQAQIACENAAKRLPTNAEWQGAVVRTPDPGPDDGTTDCNTTYQVGLDPTPTGSRSACVSARGAFDMVGNLFEWVADWVPRSDSCGSWSVSPTGDYQCFAGAGSGGEPGALLRGGSFSGGANAGPLAVGGTSGPSDSDTVIGFRCAR